MLKRVVILLLFVQFSFGQENESSLELDTEGRFHLDLNMIGQRKINFEKQNASNLWKRILSL